MLLTQADAAASCRYIAAASCAAACGRGIAAAALRLTLPPCWAAVAARTLFFVVGSFFLVRRVAAHPHFPPQFRRRRLQDLVSLALTNTPRDHDGKDIHFFFAERK